MADPVEPVTTPSPAAAPASPDPVIIESAAPVQPDPVVAASPAPDAVVPPAASGVEAPPAAENVEPAAPVAEPTLLEKFEAEQKAKADEAKPKEEAKPAEAKPEEKTAEVKAEEAKPAEAEKSPLPPIDYFAAEIGIKLPDTIKVDDAQRTELVTALDAFRADPSPASAQKIIDMGTNMMTAYADQLRRDQWSTFNDTRKDWQTKVKADPELGGARYDTTMMNVAIARDVLASRHKQGTPEYAKDMAEFDAFSKITGAGDHLVMMRILNNAARFVSEQTKQPPNPGPPPPPKAPRNRASIYSNTEFPK